MKTDPAPTGTIDVLLADSSQIQVQLRTTAMRRHLEFKVASCLLDADIILEILQRVPITVAPDRI